MLLQLGCVVALFLAPDVQALALPENVAESVDGLCPSDSMPYDWLDRCLLGHLLYSKKVSPHDLLPEVGNGHLATVMMSDTIYAAGFFNGQAHGSSGQTTHRARIPRSALWVDSVHEETPPGCGYALDMDRAVFLQRKVDPVGAPGVKVEERWYAPLHVPNLLVHEIQLENPRSHNATVRIQGVRRTDSEDLVIHEVPPQSLWAAGFSAGSAFGLEGHTRLAEGSGGSAGGGGLNNTRFALVENVPPHSVLVPAGERRVLYALAVVVTSLNSADPTGDALATLKLYTADDNARAERLLTEHTEAWRSRWESGRLEVAGDLAFAQIVNASLYFIRSSVHEDFPQGVSPGGLSSDCYHGHTFWDQETWVWPTLLMLEPSAAKSLLQYRAERTEEAKKKAQSCGPREDTSWCPQTYADRVSPKALMFPWESAHTGTEVQYTDGKIGPWGRYEQHISGDIALALRQYWYATGDRAWLKEVGFPLAEGIAAFYAARLEDRAPEGGLGARYDLAGVMGPDEYQWPVKNSAYSNAVARAALAFAHEAARELEKEGPEFADFLEKAQGLQVLLAPAPGGGYHPEYEDFPENGHNVLVKQADTILLSYPVDLNFSSQVLRNDLDFYTEITDPNGPAMTWSMFAMGWLSLGEVQKSRALFRRGFANSHLPFRVWSEFPTGASFPGCVNFITGAGGFLQSLLFGVAGLRVRSTHLHFSPTSPSATGTRASKVILQSVHYKGSRLRFEIDGEGAQCEVLAKSESAPDLCLMVQEKVLPMPVGRTQSLALSQPVTLAECGRETDKKTDMVAQTTSTTFDLEESVAAKQRANAVAVNNSNASPSPTQPPDTATQVKVVTMVENVDFARLAASPPLTAAFKQSIAEVLALEVSSVQPEDVEVTLAPGSVHAESVLSTPNSSAAAAARKTLQQESGHLAEVLKTRLTGLKGMNTALTGQLRLRHLRVLPPAVDGRVPAVPWPWLPHPWQGPGSGGHPWFSPLGNPTAALCLGALLLPLPLLLLLLLRCLLRTPRGASASSSAASGSFNGTWVRRCCGATDMPGARESGDGSPPSPLKTGVREGSIMVIIGDTVNRQGRKSRILHTPQEGYQITDLADEEVHSIELLNGEVVIGGQEYFSRWQPNTDSQEGSRLLCCQTGCCCGERVER